MKKFIFCIFSTLMFTAFAETSVSNVLSEKFGKYIPFVGAKSMEELIPLLEDAVISFSDFERGKDITCFKCVTPDTIWIKERPKKNPKEGKHYTLRYLYHSELASTYYSYITKNNTYERTPAIEFVGSQFHVDKVEPISSSKYSLSRNYKISLTNTTTGEKLIWIYQEDIKPCPECIIHLVSISDSIGLVGQNLYSAKCESFMNDKFSNVTRHNVKSVDAQINLTYPYPGFQIRFTTVDEQNKVFTYTLPLKSSSSNATIGSLVWLDESQAEDARISNLTFEIDYFIRLESLKEFPFDFSFILGVPESYGTSVYQKLKPESYQVPDDYISNEDIIFIGDKISVRGKEYYKGILDGKAFYVSCKNIKILDEDVLKLDSLLNSSQSVRDTFFEYSKKQSYLYYISKIEKALKEIQSYAANGISIPSWSVYDMSEYTEGTGVRFSFHNPTNKTIKYININFVGYNAVDDRVGQSVSKRCVGPIEPDETASYDFEYVWFTDVVEYSKITSLSVQYKDGTTKIVSKPSSVVWSTDTKKALSSSSLSHLKSELITSE